MSKLNAVAKEMGKPVDGWNMLPIESGRSLTMYNAQSFFVENPINRYDIAAWMPLKYDKAGSLDIYIEIDSPGRAFAL